MVAAANSENQMPQMASNIHSEAANCTENNGFSRTQHHNDDVDVSFEDTKATFWSYMEITWECVRTLLGILYLILETAFKQIIPVKYQSKSIKGYNVLITGAGSGIGRSLARKFAKMDCNVILWDINKESNEETAAIIRAHGKSAHTYVCDVTSKLDIYKTADKVRSEVGHVDILVNNAGVVTGKNFLDCSDQEIMRTMQVNVLAHFWTIRAFLPEMIRRNSGHIVTISSVAGLIGLNKLTGYCASKFACVGLNEALRCELNSMKKHGIHLTLACPYYTDTGMFEGAKTRFPTILPVLKTKFVAEKIIEAVLSNQEVLYVPRMIYLVAFLKGYFPVKCWSLILRFTGSYSLMDDFRGRPQEPTVRPSTSQQPRKNSFSPIGPQSIFPMLSTVQTKASARVEEIFTDQDK
ncbi:epidermal retinol dehydrogenase 2-like [Argonauta hians]